MYWIVFAKAEFQEFLYLIFNIFESKSKDFFFAWKFKHFVDFTLLSCMILARKFKISDSTIFPNIYFFAPVCFCTEGRQAKWVYFSPIQYIPYNISSIVAFAKSGKAIDSYWLIRLSALLKAFALEGIVVALVAVLPLVRFAATAGLAGGPSGCAWRAV